MSKPNICVDCQPRVNDCDSCYESDCDCNLAGHRKCACGHSLAKHYGSAGDCVARIKHNKVCLCRGYRPACGRCGRPVGPAADLICDDCLIKETA
jgi:hypothetical protein